MLTYDEYTPNDPKRMIGYCDGCQATLNERHRYRHQTRGAT
jgi:hypothetical protein